MLFGHDIVEFTHVAVVGGEHAVVARHRDRGLQRLRQRRAVRLVQVAVGPVDGRDQHVQRLRDLAGTVQPQAGVARLIDFFAVQRPARRRRGRS